MKHVVLKLRNDVVSLFQHNKCEIALLFDFFFLSKTLSVMALLRLPGISLQILGHKSNQKNPNPNVAFTNHSLSLSTPSLCRLHRHATFPDSIPAKSRNLTSYFSTTTQEPVLESSSSSSSAPEVVEEEISKTRLIAQNVPWTSTPEDIRSLFEKYGSVIDIEVFGFSRFLLLKSMN